MLSCSWCTCHEPGLFADGDSSDCLVPIIGAVEAANTAERPSEKLQYIRMALHVCGIFMPCLESLCILIDETKKDILMEF